MRRAWFFGCSHVTGYDISDCSLRWSSMICRHFAWEERNLARDNNTNDGIMHDILAARQDIKSHDIVLVQMTHAHRLIYDGKIMRPSDPEIEPEPIEPIRDWWFKTVTADDFYANRLLSMSLAVRHVLHGTEFYQSFADPSLLLAKFNQPGIKDQFRHHTIYHPKLTLHKSYDMNAQGRHMSQLGNAQAAQHWISKLSDLSH